MIYVDYTECLPKKNQRFHGGANYGKRVIKLLTQHNMFVSVLVPKGYILKNDDEIIIQNKWVQVIYIDKIENFISDSENDILFIPLIKTRRLNVIKKIKVNNPKIKVYLTIHGVRRIGLKPDILDRYYYEGIRFYCYPVYKLVEYFSMKILYKILFARMVPMYDKVFTVSNFSLFTITQMCMPKYIKWFYQGGFNEEIKLMSVENRRNYALFVSAGREEKNFLRTLIAFCQYIKESNSNIKLVATGISDKKKKLILRLDSVDKNIVSQYVDMYDYVETDTLVDLYQTCKFLIYPSKSEGFGLPIIEAAMYGTPVLAAYGSAIPEVLISSVDYINPYSIDDIKRGIQRYDRAKTEIMVDRIIRKQRSVLENIKSSDEDFVEEFMND